MRRGTRRGKHPYSNCYPYKLEGVVTNILIIIKIIVVKDVGEQAKD